jgi:hypothetical protein
MNCRLLRLFVLIQRSEESEEEITISSARSKQEEDRIIKKLQDKEFRQSLKVDKEKVLIPFKRCADMIKDMKRKQEKEAANKKAALIKSRQEKAALLLPEPSDSEHCLSILLRLPSGRRITRRYVFGTPLQLTCHRFYKDDKLSNLLEFVDTTLVDADKDIETYVIATHFPRKVISELNKDDKLSDALGPEATHALFVETI